MKKIITPAFGLFFLFILSPIAQENKIEPYSHKDFDESYCVRAMPEPILLSISPDFPPPTIEWVPHRTLREIVQLSPETVVEVEQGGCETAYFSFTFFVMLEDSNSSPQLTWNDVKTYLRLLNLSKPWNDFPEFFIDNFKAFNEGQALEKKSVYPSETITLNFEITSPSSSKVILKFEYVQIL